MEFRVPISHPFRFLKRGFDLLKQSGSNHDTAVIPIVDSIRNNSRLSVCAPLAFERIGRGESYPATAWVAGVISPASFVVLNRFPRYWGKMLRLFFCTLGRKIMINFVLLNNYFENFILLLNRAGV